MGFDLKHLLASHCGENHSLHESYLNPQFVHVLKTIGFDKRYERAEGPYLYDDAGQRYLDFISGYGVFNLGRNHPVIKQALQDVLSLDLANMVQMDSPLLAGLLAERLISIAPASLNKVFFTNSGAESVEGAIKFARRTTGREKIIYTHQAYHGLTMGSLSVNGCTEFNSDFGELLSAHEIPFNDLEALESVLQPKDTAAFIVEPIQGKGVQLPDDEYLLAAQRLCHRYGSLLILDEVQTGFGRTGKMFAAEHWGVEPDLMTVAKSLSGGYVPLGAVLMSDRVYESVYPDMDHCVVHSSTFGQNQLAMVCGLAFLAELSVGGFIERAARLGDLLLNTLQTRCAEFEMFDEIRGMGLMLAVSFKQPKSFKLKMAWKAIHSAHGGMFGQLLTIPLMGKYRILTQVAGHHSDAIKLMPPLLISEEDVEYFIQAFQAVVADCHIFPGGAWDVGMGIVKRALRQR